MSKPESRWCWGYNDLCITRASLCGLASYSACEILGRYPSVSSFIKLSKAQRSPLGIQWQHRISPGVYGSHTGIIVIELTTCTWNGCDDHSNTRISTRTRTRVSLSSMME